MGITISQPFGSNDLIRSHEFLNRLDKLGADSVRHFAKNFLESETVPDFCTIEIETQNRCNNDCAFCPVNRHNDTRKPAVMDEKVFYSVIDQLRDMDYCGQVSLFSNNEPLLDGRILKFIEHAKKSLPNAEHTLYTNGLLLNEEKFMRLTENLDHLIIDNYDDNFQLLPPVKKILKNISRPEDFKCDISIALRKKNQKLNTRAGSAPNRINEENIFRPQSPCILPFTQMIVRPDGTTAKCCNDPLNALTTGDLSVQTLREIWRGKVYQDLRKELFFNGRQNIPGCEFCDIFGLYNYLPSFAKPNGFKHFVDELRLRRNLGAIYIFDTTLLSVKIFASFKSFALEFDGFVDFRGDGADKNYNCVTLERAISERAFMLIPTPHYDDEVFTLLAELDYQYERDYLIFPPELLQNFFQR